MTKKVLALSVALFAAVAGAHAQRLVDLQATLVNPPSNSTITSGQQFTIDVTVKNAGTTQLKATDTVAIIFYIDNTNNIIKDGNGQAVGSAFTGQVMNPNDTKTVTLNMTLTHSITGQHSFCTIAGPVNRSADSVKDNNTANNSSCSNNITFAGSTSVGQVFATVSKHAVSAAYPNPATGSFSFDVKMGDNDVVDIKLVDLTGRTVFTSTQGRQSTGEHTFKVQPANVPAGIYLYEVKIGDEKFHGKVTLQ